ncbi:MAG TPA: hypothetical protein VJ323_03835 [Bryobacteraceae bacterium]|jgi:hypothetical protein|nr:hypothetical protein [Bryobacteraceae bacterium]
MTRRKPTKAQLEREKALLRRKKARIRERIKDLRWDIAYSKQLGRRLKKEADGKERNVKSLIAVARRRDKERIKYLLSAQQEEKRTKKLEEKLECLIATK